MNTDCEYAVIGAGVIGLAIARALAIRGADVLILEKESAFGQVTSARNSEVIHAGIYYRHRSLKARCCVQGREALYEYCRDRAIAHQRCGKLIVACDEEQLVALEGIRKRALNNGVSDIRFIDATEARAMEPELGCVGALHSPSTGIVDSHGLMLSLLADAENHGAILSCHSPVSRLLPIDRGTGWTLWAGDSEPVPVTARHVINAAGHGACELFNQALLGAGITDTQSSLQPVLLKGNYFRLQGKAPFSRLIYPVPEPGGLGVHLTLDLAGQARFGPDVEPVEKEDYRVAPERGSRFYSAIRNYWPGLLPGALEPDYAGIRPRVERGQTLQDDFLLISGDELELPGLTTLAGIESPGLTSSLAIADLVASRLQQAH